MGPVHSPAAVTIHSKPAKSQTIPQATRNNTKTKQTKQNTPKTTT
jgi:hypothetical protein